MTEPTVAHEPVLSATPTGEVAWQVLRHGLERRLIKIYSGEGKQLESLYMLRVDPSSYDIAVAYRPSQALTLSEWQTETNALIVMNGGFYTPDLKATALVVVDGVTHGKSYQGFGGMLAIRDSKVAIWALADQPYDPADKVDFALQSFPVLVTKHGGNVYSGENGQPARRTVIAQDRAGRVLFIVAPWGALSLAELGDYLASPELEIETALNLDGGASTGLLLADPEEGYPAFTAIPSVILVRPR